jgi:hypothetical protein
MGSRTGWRLSRNSPSFFAESPQGVDGRDKPGHDDAQKRCNMTGIAQMAIRQV